jgi:hypothetical protein
MLDVEQAMLAEQFAELLAREQEAATACAELLAKVTDSNAHQQLQQIHREKVRHVQLVQRLLEIVE